MYKGEPQRVSAIMPAVRILAKPKSAEDTAHSYKTIGVIKNDD